MLDGVISGLISGSANAILAVCVVALYRLTGVVNVGLAAIGALGAYSCFAIVGAGLPLGAAVLVGIAVSGLVAGLGGFVLARWFGQPSATTRLVVSTVLLIVILTLGFRLFGDSPRVMPSLVPEVSLVLAGVRVSLATLVALACALLIAGGLTLLLTRTRIGHRLEAMSERPVTLQLLGVNTRVLAVAAWSATGMLAALAMLLVAPTRNPTFESMSFLIVPALAAALLGAFSNVWIAACGGLAIGALEGAGARIDWLSSYRGAIPFIIIIVALIWLRRREVWDAPR